LTSNVYTDCKLIRRQLCSVAACLQFWGCSCCFCSSIYCFHRPFSPPLLS